MKKKILIGIYLLLVLCTAIFFVRAAIDSYNYDMENHIDIMAGFGAVICIMVGGFIVFCETDVFFTVYYLLVKPKTWRKTLFMLLSQLMLSAVIFGDEVADFLSRYVSDVFREDGIVVAFLFLIYVILRFFCIVFCFSGKNSNP